MRRKSGHQEPSQRQLRVGEELRHLISEVLQRGKFHDAALMDAGRITVTEVRISPDLKHATAYVLTLGGLDMDTVLPALNEASSQIQHDVSRKLKIKFTPRIRFVTDTTFDEADRIEHLLRGIVPEERA